MIGACGGGPAVPSPVITLTVSPNPIPYVSLPPRVPPGQTTPDCCFTLDATWTAIISSNRRATISSQHVRLADAQSGLTLGDADTLAMGGVGRSVAAGQRTSVEMKWLGEVGSGFRRSSRLRMELTLTFDLGEGVRDQEVAEVDWTE